MPAISEHCALQRAASVTSASEGEQLRRLLAVCGAAAVAG